MIDNIDISEELNDNSSEDFKSLTFKDMFERVKSELQTSFKQDFVDGQDVLIGGNPDECIKFNHLQGDNYLGFNGTCGLVSCEDVLKQHGLNISENDVVWHATTNGECNIDTNPDLCGGTTPFDQAEILRDYGVDAEVVNLRNVYDLADRIESDRSVIIGVNAGVLWDDIRYYGTGEPNHAIVPTGVVRDANDYKNILGFYINDSGTGQSKQFIPINQFEEMWRKSDGIAVVTLEEHPKFK